MKPFARALTDFHTGVSNAAFTINRDDGFQVKVPASTFFQSQNFPSLELKAMEECKGHILDVGSAAGRHSLELIQRGLKVTSLDILPEVESIMNDRGQADVLIADIMSYSGQSFDTVLMLMNGIGMVGSIEGLERFLSHAHSLVRPNGQIICDSIDVSVAEDPQHVTYREKNIESGYPAGQQAFSMDYNGEDETRFDWLHIDFSLLSEVCKDAEWSAELLDSEDDGHFLCKLTPRTN